MATFQNPPLVRDVDDSRRINVATPCALRISVSDARQLVPTGAAGANTLLLFSGMIRFGQDGDSPGEDLSNELSEYAETGGDDTPRTVMLQLRGTGRGGWSILRVRCICCVRKHRVLRQMILSVPRSTMAQ